MHVSVLSLDFETKFFAVDLGDVIEGMLTPAGIGWCGVVDGDMDAGVVVMTFRSPSWSPGGGGAMGVAASGETSNFVFRRSVFCQRSTFYPPHFGGGGGAKPPTPGASRLYGPIPRPCNRTRRPRRHGTLCG